MIASKTVSLLTLILLGSVLLVAQTAGTGALNVTVTDPAGALVPDAQVRLISDATGEVRTGNTGGTGSFVFALVPPGTFRIEVSHAGFKPAARTAVPVIVTETARINIALEVGTSTETVSVQAEAEMVQSETSTLGRVASEEVVVGLPLVARNYTQIIGLSAGIASDVTNASDLGRGRGGVAPVGASGGTFVHGQRAYDNNFLMNGVEVNDYAAQDTFSGGVPIPNPDTIQEFKVQTGQYDASFGTHAGANVNVVTRTGSNAFHGTLFEFFRNDHLNANDFFSNRNGRPKPELRQNQFGATLGGPVIKDKLLFFGSYQGTRQINGVAGLQTVFGPPLTNDRSAAALGSLFAGQRGSLQGTAGPAILADGSNINPVALKLLQFKLPNGSYLIPTPQTINPALPFGSRGVSTFNSPSTFDEDQYMINADYLQSSRSKFSERVFTATSDQVVAFPNGNLPGFPQPSHNLFVSATLSHSFVITPSLFNEAHAGYNRTATHSGQVSPFSFSDLGVNAPDQINAFPNFNIIGSYQFGTQFVTDRIQNTFNYDDSLSWVHGRHTIRAGGSFVRGQRNFEHFTYPGLLYFLSFPDFMLGLSGAQNGTGIFSNVYLSIDILGLIDRAARFTDVGAYVQDDYRLSDRLTLNIGLRYDHLGKYSDALGRATNFDPSRANPNPPASGTNAGFLVPSNFPNVTLPADVVRTSTASTLNGNGNNNVGPRVGAAYKLLPHSDRVVLRGGYGIYYSLITGQSNFQSNTSPPFAVFNNLSLTANAGATLQNPFPAALPFSAYPAFRPATPTTAYTITSVDPNIRPGIVQQYSFNVQTEVAHDFLLEVGYVGARGKNLLREVSVNQAGFATATNPIRGVTTNTVANVQLRVPIEGYTAAGLQQVQSQGRSYYDALEVSMTKRFSKGLQFLASYTFSKTLDTDGANALTSANAGGSYGDQTRDDLRYGPTNFSRPHRFITSFLYQFPQAFGGHGFAGRALSGWGTAGVVTIQAGNPLTFFYTNSNNVFGISNDRAQIVSGCTYNQLETPGTVTSKLGNYFNAACFTTPPVVGSDGKATTFGNSGVGIVSGPAQNNVDLSVVKDTRIAERYFLQFRAEFFNAFNTPQFANPNTTYGTGTFGQVSGVAVNPRIGQLALKLVF